MHRLLREQLDLTERGCGGGWLWRTHRHSIPHGEHSALVVEIRKWNLPALALGAHLLYPQGPLDIAALWRLSFSRAGTLFSPGSLGLARSRNLTKYLWDQ